MKKTTLEEKSAGGVVYRKMGDSYEFLIGKHSGYQKWVLPKGLIEKGESEIEAAQREVEEEVGVKTKVIGVTPIKTIEYWYYADLKEKMGLTASGKESERRVGKYQEEGGKEVRIHKRVVFYLMEMEEDLDKEGWEMSERKWVAYEEGIKTLAFETEKEVFTAAWKVIGASGQN